MSGGGVSEIIQDARTGWLVVEPSVDGLAIAMAEAAADRERCATMGENARRFVEQECRIETMCERYADVYGDVVGHRAGGLRRGTSPASDRRFGRSQEPGRLLRVGSLQQRYSSHQLRSHLRISGASHHGHDADTNAQWPRIQAACSGALSGTGTPRRPGIFRRAHACFQDLPSWDRLPLGRSPA